MNKLALLFVFITVSCFGHDWSRNNILKYTPQNTINFTNIMDYENIENSSLYINPTTNTNAWLKTFSIPVGSDFVISSAFVDFSVQDSNSYLILGVRDGNTDELLQEKTFYHSGKLDLINLFQKQLYLTLEMVGSDIRVYSFGLVRQTEEILMTNDALLTPDILFYEENSLKIDFYLHFPAYLDVILFDSEGQIIDYVAKRQFFQEGQNTLFWEPTVSQSPYLSSGKHMIYFRVKSADGKVVEITKKFNFVKE